MADSRAPIETNHFTRIFELSIPEYVYSSRIEVIVKKS